MGIGGDKMVPKVRAFINEYLKDFNGTKAAIRAGYSPKSAHVKACTLLKDPKVKVEIEAFHEKQKESLKESGITRDYVLSIIKQTVERCIQAVPVKDKDGTVLGEFKFDAANALRGAELLGRYIGMEADTSKIEEDPASTKELLQRIRDRAKNYADQERRMQANALKPPRKSNLPHLRAKENAAADVH